MARFAFISDRSASLLDWREAEASSLRRGGLLLCGRSEVGPNGTEPPVRECQLGVNLSSSGCRCKGPLIPALRKYGQGQPNAIRKPSRKERLAAEELRHILNADLVGSYCPLVTSPTKLRSS